MLIRLDRWRLWQLQALDALINGLSVVVCVLLLPMRLPGMEILGIGPHWALIWVVSWSVKRTVFQGAIAGAMLGLLQDSLTRGEPSNVWGLMLAGILTARLQKQKYIQEDIISQPLIVFGMAILNETVMALQYTILGIRPVEAIWQDHQRIALATAILSSLWSPAVYLPLSAWWKKMAELQQ